MVLAAIAFGLYQTGFPLAGPMQLALVAPAILLALPHGGADLLLARDSLRPHLATWWLPVFLLGYLGLGAATLLLWLLEPAAAFMLFLALSILHFGSTDARAAGTGGVLPILALGAAPLLVPAWVHPAEMTRLLAALAGDGGAMLARWGAQHGIWLWALASVTASVRWLAARNPRPLVQLAVVGILFAILPPLVAFALYFGLLHATRAMAQTSARTGHTIASLLRASAWPSIAAAALIAAGYLVLRQGMASAEAALVALFVGLAALTVPHMALDALASLLPAATRQKA